MRRILSPPVRSLVSSKQTQRLCLECGYHMREAANDFSVSDFEKSVFEISTGFSSKWSPRHCLHGCRPHDASLTGTRKPCQGGSRRCLCVSDLESLVFVTAFGLRTWLANVASPAVTPSAVSGSSRQFSVSDSVETHARHRSIGRARLRPNLIHSYSQGTIFKAHLKPEIRCT